jgi:putative membrane protein
MRSFLYSVPALGAVSPAWSQTWPGDHWMWHSHWGWGGMLAGGLGMILFWAVIILLIVLVVRGLSGGRIVERGVPAAGPNSALQILQERFARGEIDKDEYEERRKVLAS